MSDTQEIYQTFRETRQEPRKLKAALQGFFSKDNAANIQKEEYGQYLKRRIRPAVEQLIEEEAVEKIQTLEELGWFHEKELDGFINTSIQRQKPASLMWFLQLKNKKYGFSDQDFSL